MKVLIVRLGALGDIVHAIPVAVALRRAYPDARIDWLVSARHREILDLVPVIDELLVINDRSGARDGLSIPVALAHARHTRYDVALDLQGLLKSALIARLSGARRVIGFSRRYAREPYATLFYTETHDPGGDGLFARSETRHVANVNLSILARLGIAQPALEFSLAAPESPRVQDTVAQARLPYALLNVGAAWPNKRWPPDRFGALARMVYERHGMRSIVLWGPGERLLAEAVVSNMPDAAVLAPATSIADLVALARGAALMVSGDTGPAHIASAVGTPLVGIYGPTRPERNGPLRPDDVSVSRASVCQCHHMRHCRLTRMCLLDIDVAEVAAAVDERLARVGLTRG